MLIKGGATKYFTFSVLFIFFIVSGEDAVQMFNMLFSNIFDTKIFDDQAEGDGMCVVPP